jgi:hypothetical protein
MNNNMPPPTINFYLALDKYVQNFYHCIENIAFTYHQQKSARCAFPDGFFSSFFPAPPSLPTEKNSFSLIHSLV